MEVVTRTSSATKVKVDRLFHREKNCLAIYFPYDGFLLTITKQIPAVRFSATHKCWYVEEVSGIMNVIFELYQRHKVFVDYEALKNTPPPAPAVQASLLSANTGEKKTLNEEQQKALRMMEQKLHLKGYTENTTKTYLYQFKEFLHFYGNNHPVEITEIEIRNYLLYLVENKQVSKSTQNQAINGIKFFYEIVLGQTQRTYYIERPMRDRQLPHVLSEEDVFAIFEQAGNLKHTTLLMLIYAAGLRRSELMNLKPGDVDFNRLTVFIRGGKGRKDRQSILAKNLVPLLQEYIRLYKPTKWLYEGIAGEQYSATSMQHILRRAVKKAGILKEVKLHTLRHSFATHLLESGTSTRYIQTLLGHESSRTTEIYTQVSRFALEKIKSPLDNLLLLTEKPRVHL